MSSDWPLKPLQLVAREVTVGYVGPMASEYVESGVPFLRSLNIEPFGVNTNDLKFITPDFHNRIRKSILRPGDVAIVRTGKPGTCAVIPDWLEEANCSDLVVVRCGDEIRPHFLCYWVNSIASHHISSHTVGAVQQHFNVGAAKTMNVAVPSLKDQDKVLEVLRGLDDRITLLRETNATLEAIAQALFKSWFVDFDPVRAKMAGRIPEGMDEATAALFPDALEETELGLVPKGWQQCCVDDVASLKGGKQLEKELFKSEGLYPVFGGAGVMGRCDLFNAEGFVITVGRVGAYCGQYFWTQGKAWVNNNASLVSAKTSAHSVWLLHWLKSVDMDVIKKGAAQPFVSNGDIAALKMALPPDGLIRLFVDVCAPIYLRLSELALQAQTLTDLRDTLLPRLISGQLRLTGNDCELVSN